MPLTRLLRRARAMAGHEESPGRAGGSASAPTGAGPSPSTAPAPKRWSEDRARELIRVRLRPSVVEGQRLNLLIPPMQTNVLFGGVQTALDLFEAIGASTRQRRIVSLGPIDEAVASRLPGYRMAGADEDPPDPLQLVSIGADDASLAVAPTDVFVATFWSTADLAIRIVRWQAEQLGSSPGRFGYLIQDFEPGFYPWSTNHLLALATYRSEIPAIAIYNTSLLRDYFHHSGLRFAHEFAFEPRLGPVLRRAMERPREEPRERQIVLYGRPRTPRNAFPLLVEALRVWRAREPASSTWSVVSVGQMHPDVDLGGGSILRSRGKLGLEDYGRLLRDSAIGLSFMVSPHPSYPPLEMAHLGMLVLTNRFAAKDLSGWHTNIRSLDEVSIDGVATALADLCRLVEADPGIGDRGVSAMSDYLSDEPQFPFAPEVAGLLVPSTASSSTIRT
jgi:beta-1,2-rhamnosyltransferase WsaF-like protein